MKIRIGRDGGSFYGYIFKSDATDASPPVFQTEAAANRATAQYLAERLIAQRVVYPPMFR